jgi:hypothetical protein
MERTSPDYNDPNFGKKPEDSFLDKYEKTMDTTFNTVNTVYSAGRRIGYVFMGLFFLAVGGGLLVWGIFNYNDRIEELNTFEKTFGTVVDFREVPETENSGVTYAPIITFKDADGKEIRYESNHSSDPPAHKIGEKVGMFYNKKNPKDAFVDSFWGKWWGTIVLAIFVLVTIPIGLWMIFTGFRRNKKVKYEEQEKGNGSQGTSYVNFG